MYGKSGDISTALKCLQLSDGIPIRYVERTAFVGPASATTHFPWLRTSSLLSFSSTIGAFRRERVLLRHLM